MSNITETFSLPAPVAAAFDRCLQILANADAFEDKVYYLHELVDSIRQWRYVGACTATHEAVMLRKVRKEVEANMGAVTTSDTLSALEVAEREKRNAALS
jgi:hypothetical protein